MYNVLSYYLRYPLMNKSINSHLPDGRIIVWHFCPSVCKYIIFRSTLLAHTMWPAITHICFDIEDRRVDKYSKCLST